MLAVVDHGGFTRAAEALHLAQPSLSQAVRTLEAELGVELFHRTGRSVTLSAAGEALVGPARQALRDADNARAAVAQVVGLEAGHLDLVSLPTLAVHPAAELIGRFRREHTKVTVRLVEPEDADAVAQRVRDGSSEIGFAELPVPRQDLEVVPLGTQQYVVLVPAELRATFGGDDPVSLFAVARQPLVTTPPGTSTRRLIHEQMQAQGLVPTVAVETDHREAIGPLVMAGAGVAIVPRDLAERFAGDASVLVREVTPSIERSIGLIHRSGPLSPAAHAFLAGASPRARPRPRRRSPSD